RGHDVCGGRAGGKVGRAVAQHARGDRPAGVGAGEAPARAGVGRQGVGDRDVLRDPGPGVGDRDREADLLPGVDRGRVGGLGDRDRRAVHILRRGGLVAVCHGGRGDAGGGGGHVGGGGRRAAGRGGRRG